jgi:hypothetical protein
VIAFEWYPICTFYIKTILFIKFYRMVGWIGELSREREYLYVVLGIEKR